MLLWFTSQEWLPVGIVCGEQIKRNVYTTGMRPICFLTDFGLSDDFVGTCRGVIERIAPGVTVIDLTHEVSGFKIEEGAEILQHATRYMPDNVVYLAVVDPGVGTERRALALETENGASLVGPDNGLLIPAARSLGGIREAVELTNERYHVQPVSSTFHGRDLFAPAAAHVASGTSVTQLGERVDASSLVRLDLPGVLAADGQECVVKVLSVDRYGNARLSITQEESGLEYGASLEIDTGDGFMAVKYLETFGSAKTGELVLVPDSHWRLSLAVNKGNASQALMLGAGTRITLKMPNGGTDAGA